jgi:homoserine dehydrogenase
LPLAVASASARSPAPTPRSPRGAVAVPRPLTLQVAGAGTVSRAFLRAVAPFAAAGEVRVVSVSDRSGTVHDPAGIDPAAAAAAKEAGGLRLLGLPLLPFEGAAAAARLPADAVVDLSTGDLSAAVPGAFPLVAGLAAGKHGVTASKAPLALFPAEVEALRRRSGRALLASATVGGAVPILEVLSGALRGAGVLEVAGAWNATSTFVLSRVEEGAAFAEALAEARALGYAEADASADLDGRDAAAKAAIVAAAAFGLRIGLARVPRRGAADLDPAALRAAGRRGRRTRLVARVTPAGASVAPEAHPEDHPLATSPGESAVLVRTALAGTLALRGPGAGGPATASAVLNDVLALSRGRAAPVPLAPVA